MVLTNNGSGSLSWAATGAGSYILNSNSLQANSTFYVTSGTVAGPFAATGPVALGSANNAVTISSNLVVNAGGVISGNGSGLTNLPVTSLTGTNLPGGSTSYVQIGNSLQASSTFYVSSGTVNSLTVGSSIGLPANSVAAALLPAAPTTTTLPWVGRSPWAVPPTR